MKVFLILFMSISLNFLYSQEVEINYPELIRIIKNSEIFLKFKQEYKFNGKLKVSSEQYSICELWPILDKKLLSGTLSQYCRDFDWKKAATKKDSSLDGLSNAGRKDNILRFSDIYDNYITAQVSDYEQRNNHSVIYLFKIENGKVVLLHSGDLFSE